MFKKNTSGEARVGAWAGYNMIILPHMLFPHINSICPSYSEPSTIKRRIAGLCLNLSANGSMGDCLVEILVFVLGFRRQFQED